MDKETQLRRKPDLMAVDMDGEVVMMDMQSGQYFGLSGIGPHIWATLEHTTSAHTIIDTIRDTFAVDAPHDPEADILAFLDSLLENGLIEKVAA